MKWSARRRFVIVLIVAVFAGLGCRREPAATPPSAPPSKDGPSEGPGPEPAETSQAAKPGARTPDMAKPKGRTPGDAPPQRNPAGSASPGEPLAGQPVWDPLAAIGPDPGVPQSKPAADLDPAVGRSGTAAKGPSGTAAPKASARTMKMSIEKQTIGKTPDGTEVDQYTLTNSNGLKVQIITYGAMITSVEVPDRNGNFENVTLYRDTLEDYLAGHPFFGCVVGRYANRIAKGKFTLDGTEYTLATNNGPNHLHGGVKGFDKYVWKAEPKSGDGSVGVTFSHLSPDGDEGYPGELKATVTYSLTDNNELKMEYTATTDKPTVVNLTNHAYWNLAGAGSGDVLGHELMLCADRFLPVDDGLIPLGPPESVQDTPMDFTEPKTIGARIDQVEGGYDHCYVLNKKEGERMSLAARVVEPKSGRVMEVSTTQPAVQLYTGNFLDGAISGGGVAYKKHDGFCLETQHFPDSPNHPEYPSTVLRPGQKYHELTVHKFSVQP